MILAIFDLDNTLLGGDSDHSWGEFLVEKDVVDKTQYKRANDQFYQDYLDGTLDMNKYVRFALEPISQMTPETRETLHQDFMESKIKPMTLPKAAQLIEQHRKQGHTLIIITATNRFITGPIAESLGIDHLLATEGEIINNRYTGDMVGTPCFQEGKIHRLNTWLSEQALTIEELENSFFYSDSINDLPLLQMVKEPFAVDPDEKLRKHAESHDWPIISLR